MDNFPKYDKWGILNWARDSNRKLWDLVPAARSMMLEAAAVRRWRANYQHRNSVTDFMDYAEFLAANLKTETAGFEGWAE